MALALLAGVGPDAASDGGGEAAMERQRVLSAERAAREAEHELVARLCWEQERRRSVAHARMRDTMYASMPSRQAVELSCPVALFRS